MLYAYGYFEIYMYTSIYSLYLHLLTTVLLFPLTLPVNLCRYICKKYGLSHSVARHLFPCVIMDRADKPLLLKSKRHI